MNNDFESHIQAFENAWRNSLPLGALRAFLPPGSSRDDPDRLALLKELVCIDLEFRWRDASGAVERPMLDAYVSSFPELASTQDVLVELVLEEYRVRHRWGDRPPHSEYLTRFPGFDETLYRKLHDIDRELSREVEEPLCRGRIRCPASRAPRLEYADYVLTKLIGAGRTGKVYRAMRRSDSTPVAIKYLRKAFLHSDGVVERFIAEAELVARLAHPQIVGVHGLGRAPAGGLFIAMDLVEGSDLAQVLQRGLPSIEDIVHWIIQACEALDYAHWQGVIHCDVKPANLLHDHTGKVYLTDFGLARAMHESTLGLGLIAGTAAFMAPEQISSYWGPIGPRTDVYGIGATLYALLTGSAPFRGPTVPEILSLVVSSIQADSPSRCGRAIPEALERVCLRCLEKNPAHRFASADELKADLLSLH